MFKKILVISIIIFLYQLFIYSADNTTDELKITTKKLFTLNKDENLMGEIYFLTLDIENINNRIAYKIVNNNKNYYIIEDKKYGPYLTMDNFQYCTNGTNWGFSASAGNDWYVFLKSEKLGAYKYASSPKFSDDGKNYGFKAQKNNGDYVVINGKEYGPYENVTFPVISKENNFWAYCYSKNNLWYVRFNSGKEFGPYDLPSNCEFNKKGSIWGFIALKKSKHYIIINEKEYGPYKTIGDLYLYVNTWGYQYNTDEGMFYLINNKRYGKFTDLSPLYFNSNGSNWAYAGLLLGINSWYIFFDNKESKGTYEYMPSIHLSENGNNWNTWYIDQKRNEGYIYINEIKFGPFEFVIEPSFNSSSTSWLFCAKKKEGIFIVKDNKEIGPYNYIDIDFFNTTEDLNNWGFIGNKEGTQCVVINGKEFDSDIINFSYSKNQNIFYWTFQRDKNVNLSMIKFKK